jgi:hypothetical protein
MSIFHFRFTICHLSFRPTGRITEPMKIKEPVNQKP